MSKLQKIKDEVKAIWKDNSGISLSLEHVGYAIAIITLAGIIAAIGITATKSTASDFAGDLQSFSVDANNVDSTSATGKSFSLTDGNHSVSTVTLEN